MTAPRPLRFTKYGGYVPLTLELLDKDDTRKLRAYGIELGKAGIRNISEQIAAIFTSNSGAGPTMADTGALFNATAVTTAGGHANLLTTALGTDFTAWDAVAAAVYNQPLLRKNATGYYGTGKKMAIEPRFCLVPRALKAAAEALFIPRWAAHRRGCHCLQGRTHLRRICDARSPSPNGRMPRTGLLPVTRASPRRSTSVSASV